MEKKFKINEFFRDATPEEREYVQKRIQELSAPTGVNFFTDYKTADIYLDGVREYLSKEEILTALAEEAAELSQAALKLRRALTRQNYTPKSVDECEASLIEEIQDVNNCVRALGYESVGINIGKIKRWITRLEDDGK